MTFDFDGKLVNLNQTQKFIAQLNPNVSFWELEQMTLYGSVVLGANSSAEIVDDLRMNMLSFLWEDFALSDSVSTISRTVKLSFSGNRR